MVTKRSENDRMNKRKMKCREGKIMMGRKRTETCRIRQRKKTRKMKSSLIWKKS